MPTTTKLVETVRDTVQLRLKDQLSPQQCVLKIYQEYDGGVPTIKHANGRFPQLPFDAAFAMMESVPVEVELRDGRKMTIHIKDPQGNFIVMGAIG